MEHSPKCKVVWIGGAREKMGLQVQHVRQPYFSMKETFMRLKIIYCGYSKKDLASCGCSKNLALAKKNLTSCGYPKNLPLACSEGLVYFFLRVPQAVGLYCSCHAAQASKGNFKKIYYKTFGTSGRPTQYMTLDAPKISCRISPFFRHRA